MKFASRKMPEIRSKDHWGEFVEACRGRAKTTAPFSYSGPLTETCLLGNIAKRVDARIVWDAENLKITNLPEANRYVRTEYRKGWELIG